MNSEPEHIEAFEDEKEWVRLSKTNPEFFEPLYNRYFGRIFRFLIRRTDDEGLAAELCSTTFYKALTHIKKYQWTGRPFGAWLFTIASNELKKHFRNKTPIYVVDPSEIFHVFELEESENTGIEKLKPVIASLSDDEINLLELKYFEGLTFKEISVTLDKSESALKMKLYRLLEKMKKIMES